MDDVDDEATKDRVLVWIAEAALGGLIALLIIWIAFVTLETVPFVYQGY
jgi:hypothetical protein